MKRWGPWPTTAAWESDGLEFAGVWNVAIALLEGLELVAPSGFDGVEIAAGAELPGEPTIRLWRNGEQLADGDPFEIATAFRALVGWQMADAVARAALEDLGRPVRVEP